MRDSGVVVVIPDPTILCLATHESAILAIDGPKMRNSTTLGFLSMLRMKMTKKIRLPVDTQPFQVLLDCGIQCVILSANALESEVLLYLELVEG